MIECKKCGKCCDPIMLSMKMKITPSLIPDSAPKGWLQAHWHFVGKENGYYLYQCDYYDPETHLCKIHGSKPDVCSKFPYYDYSDLAFKESKKYLPEGCAYRNENRRFKPREYQGS